QAAATPHQLTAPPPENLTPSHVPDTIPTVGQTSTTSDIGPADGNGGNERFGTPDGDPNAIDIGQTPGTGTPSTDMVYQPGLDVKSASVIARTQPFYPPVAMRMRLAGWVIVKCIIGKQGEVRDPEIVGSSNALFEKSAID